jgi:hypothetical protein
MLIIRSTSLPYRRLLQPVTTALATACFDLQHHTFTFYDLQYLFLALLFSFCYAVMDEPVWIKLPIAFTALILLVLTKTRPFMLPSLAVAGWLTLFYTCRFIPAEWRPHIYTSILPTLDHIIYGGNLSGLLANSTAPWKDLFAWVPYGVFHFVMPGVIAILIALFGPKGTLQVFGRTFGYMNMAGVLTQLFFPCAPPCKSFSFPVFFTQPFGTKETKKKYVYESLAVS